PDSCKESFSAFDVAAAIARGFQAVWPDADYRLLPVADGGEGTVEAMVDATGGRKISVPVTDPLGRQIEAHYGVLGDGHTAVIEMAEASGLLRVAADERDPRITSSFGTGELILAALDAGSRHLILGLGGSATNDGGAGMLVALGARLLNDQGQSLSAGGSDLANLSRLDLTGLDPRLAGTRVEVASDVTSPLCGPAGASAVFGPQKGASPGVVTELDIALGRFGEVLSTHCGRDLIMAPGAGAAGGMGAALLGVLDAELKPGIELVARAVGLAEALHDADLVVTGEGRLDSQTAQGKTPMGVASIARQAGVPVIALGGSVAEDAGVLLDQGIDALFGSVQRPMALNDALADAAGNLERLAHNVAATLAIGKQLSTS
ncbi:MAG: glycerate kinase, partial [Natronospirillum sp.]